jgi:hypothetical protein
MGSKSTLFYYAERWFMGITVVLVVFAEGLIKIIVKGRQDGEQCDPFTLACLPFLILTMFKKQNLKIVCVLMLFYFFQAKFLRCATTICFRMKKYPAPLMEINLQGDILTIAIQNINAHVFHSGRH